MSFNDYFKKIINTHNNVTRGKESVSDGALEKTENNAEEHDGLSFLPGEYENSIYSLIGQHIVDGKLDPSFSVFDESINDRFSWAYGAKDGTIFYHMGARELDSESKNKISLLLHRLSIDNYRATRDGVTNVLKNHPVLSFADELQKYIRDNIEELSLKDIFLFAMFTMYSTNDPETLKFALCLLELINTDSDETLKKSVRILALCDEFTLFCLFIMLSWTDPETEMLNVAKSVDGWGRIHAVRMISAERSETREWLLVNGCDNTVNQSYSAYDCYEKTDMEHMDYSSIGIDKLKAVAKIFDVLIDEGPVNGISIIDERTAVLFRFVKACENKVLDLPTYESIYSIYLYEKGEETDNHDLIDTCVRILRSDNCVKLTKDAVNEGYSSNLVDALGIETNEIYMRLLHQDFDKHNGLATRLMKKPDLVDEVIDIFDEKYIPQVDTDGKGLYYDSNELRVVFCIQELRAYPGKGVKLLVKAMKSLDPPVKNMVINVAEAWMQNTGKSILEIAPDLQEAFIERLESENDEKQRLRIKGILCNKIYKQDPIIIGGDIKKKEPKEKKYDVFVDDIFNVEEWTAPELSSIEEAQETINAFALRGKRISDIAFTSELINFRRESIEQYAYEAMGGLQGEERVACSKYENIDENLAFPMEAITDGAVILKFDDGDQFEICVDRAGKIRIAENKIPWEMACDSRLRNLEDPFNVFSSAMKETVKEIDVEYACKEVDGGITSITIQLTNDRQVRFEKQDGRCHMIVQEMHGVEAVEEYVTFRELKEQLFFDEDVHSDKEIDFISHSKMLWLGEKAERIAKGDSHELLAITNYDENPKLWIRKTDAILLIFAIYIFKNELVGETSTSEEFTSYEWEKLLELMEEISKCDTYEALYVYVDRYGVPYKNNKCGTYLDSIRYRIHNRAEETKELTKSLKEWGDAAISVGENICVNEW